MNTLVIVGEHKYKYIGPYMFSAERIRTLRDIPICGVQLDLVHIYVEVDFDVFLYCMRRIRGKEEVPLSTMEDKSSSRVSISRSGVYFDGSLMADMFDSHIDDMREHWDNYWDNYWETK